MLDQLQLRKELDEKLRGVSDDFLVDAAHAALFLDCSISTLAQRRSNGLPPPYIQLTPGRGAKVQYRMGALRELTRSQVYTNTAQSAKDKIFGRRPSTAFLSNQGEWGFWTNSSGSVLIDSVYGDAVDFGNAFGNQEEVGLAFLSWSKALQMTWLDDSRRMEYVWHFAMMFPEQGSELTSALMAKTSGEK